VRRAIVVLAVVAAPATLMTLAAADAGAGRPAPPPASGAAGAPAVVQAGVTTKARPAAARPTSQRGKGWKADDAATPPSPETAPAMSASLRLAGAAGSAHAADTASSGARAPPA